MKRFTPLIPDYKTFAGYVRLCATASGGARNRALAAGTRLACARVIAPASPGSLVLPLLPLISLLVLRKMVPLQQ